MRRYRLATCLGLMMSAALPLRSEPPGVDALIVTGLDMSDSVPAADTRRQLDAMAEAIRDPGILAAIRRGPEGRIGFALFAWHTGQVEIVSWQLIGSAPEARAVADAIAARIPVDIEAEARRGTRNYIGRLTDLSRAIDHAADLLRDAPFRPGRAVVNIIGNGRDNMGEGPRAARDRLIARGVTVNAVVLGPEDALPHYFRDQVIGGPAAFLFAGDGSLLAEMLRRKFVQDLLVALQD